MVAGLLLIVGVYGLSAALIHAFYAYSSTARARKVPIFHLVVVTKESQTRIEWYLYAYLFVSWLRGRQTVITVFDEGSTDDTCTIVNRVAREWPNVRLHSSTDGMTRFLEEHESQPLLILHLYQMDQSPKRPLHEW
ncbi:MAG: hypothetical protein K6T85_11965 [Gorillibacterium sp.]|nr:hypothetical protein [Gorillibacterium sp.]